MKTSSANDRASSMLPSRDWSRVRTELMAADLPWRAAVVDDLVHKELVKQLRDELIGHWGWKHKDWHNDHLRLERPNTPAVTRLRDELLQQFSLAWGDEYQVLDYWALLQTGTTGSGRPHWDRYGFTLSLWLTDDSYNRDEDGGGLLVYDVVNDVAEDRASASPEEIRNAIDERTSGRLLRIPYRSNRAVLLDSTNLHRTDDFRWATDPAEPESARVNLAFSFVTNAQLEAYGEAVRREVFDSAEAAAS